MAKLPTKAIWLGKPYMTAGGQRLSEGFEGTGLKEIGGPGLDIGLRGEPGGERGGAGRGGIGGTGNGNSKHQAASTREEPNSKVRKKPGATDISYHLTLARRRGGGGEGTRSRVGH